MDPRKFFAELKRRNVYKVAIAYAVVAWLLIQIATQVFPFFEIPNWGVRLVVLLIAIGFPIALLIAWAFELTSEGLKRTEVADAAPAPRLPHRAWIYVVIIAGAISVSLFLLGRYTASRTPAAEDGRPSGTSPPEKSVAVLPFVNMSSDQENTYFVDGLTEEILNRVAQIGGLKVPGRTSSFAFKNQNRDLRQIGAALGVSHVLEGSVRKAGDRLRITVQLVRTADGFHLWSQNYDRKLDDVFTIQEEIARAIADGLSLQLKLQPQTAQQPTRELDPLAWVPPSIVAIVHLSRGEFVQTHEFLARSEKLVAKPTGFQILAKLLYALSTHDAALSQQTLQTLAARGSSSHEVANQTDRKLLEIAELALRAFNADPHSVPDLRSAFTDARRNGATASHFQFLPFAAVAVAVNQRDVALDVFEEELRSPYLFDISLIWVPVFRPLRGEPRFKELLIKTKMPEYWRAAGWGDFCHAKGANDFECVVQ